MPGTLRFPDVKSFPEGIRLPSALPIEPGNQADYEPPKPLPTEEDSESLSDRIPIREGTGIRRLDPHPRPCKRYPSHIGIHAAANLALVLARGMIAGFDQPAFGWIGILPRTAHLGDAFLPTASAIGGCPRQDPHDRETVLECGTRARRHPRRRQTGSTTSTNWLGRPGKPPRGDLAPTGPLPLASMPVVGANRRVIIGRRRDLGKAPSSARGPQNRADCGFLSALPRCGFRRPRRHRQAHARPANAKPEPTERIVVDPSIFGRTTGNRRRILSLRAGVYRGNACRTRVRPADAARRI